MSRPDLSGIPAELLAKATVLGVKLPGKPKVKVEASPSAPPKSPGLLPAGGPGSWIVDIEDFYPLSLNRARNKHWSVEYRLKTRTYANLIVPMLRAGVTKAEHLRSLTIIASRPDDQHADLENALKILNDPLKWIAAIVDDGPDWLTIGKYLTRKGPARTTLLIADVPGVAR